MNTVNLDNGYAVYLITVIAIGLTAVTAVHIGPIIKELKAKRR